jgi:FixJ family two-component response regulator
LISIVDDDESVREGTMDLVRSMGFAAKAFPYPEDRRELCETFDGESECVP